MYSFPKWRTRNGSVISEILSDIKKIDIAIFFSLYLDYPYEIFQFLKNYLAAF